MLEMLVYIPSALNENFIKGDLMSMALAVAVCVKKYHLIFISAYQVVPKMAPFLVGHNFKITWKNSWIPAISSLYGMHFAWHNAVIKKCQVCLWCHIVIIITVNTIWPVSSSLNALQWLSQSTNRLCWFAQKDLQVVVLPRMALIATRF